jgi:AGCS family alanine or glycine:cation symporter
MQFVISPETYTIGEAINEATGLNTTVICIIYAVLVWVVVLGGLKKIAQFAATMLPLMSLSYIVMGLLICLLNISKLPGAFALIFEHAFTPAAAVGGFAGASLMLAFRTGVARSVFSNEAGWGLSPMAQSTAKTSHPIEQSMWGIIEVFVDTILVCSVTALVIIITGEWSSGEAGATLAMRGFRSGLGSVGYYFVPIALFIFSWTTSTGWSMYFFTLVQHAYRDKPEKADKICTFLKVIYPLPGLLFAVFILRIGLKTDIMWLAMDVTTALPIYVNIFALLFLSNKFFHSLKDYEGPRKLWDKEEFHKYDND